jgi:anti-anti-sigma factor
MSSELSIENKKIQKPDAVLMTLKGNLDLFTFRDLKSAFEEQFKNHSEKLVLLNMGAVPYIASSGWGVLMARAKALKNEGGMMALYALNEGNIKVYETLNISLLLPLAENLEDAKALLSQAKKD